MDIVYGAHIRAARALLRMEQQELAAAAGISPVTLRKIENVEGMPDVRLSTLHAIRKVLEDAGVIFTNGDEPGVKMRRKSMPAAA